MINQNLHEYLKLAAKRNASTDESEIDALSDQMVALWYELPKNQRTYIKALAADHHPISPPGYRPTEEEHVSAFRYWCLEDIVGDTLLPYWMAHTGQLDFIKRSDGVSVRERETGHLQSLMSDMFQNTNRQGEFWDVRWHVDHGSKTGFEAFKFYMQEDLNSHHEGDCTYVACGCARCHAESRYGLPSTAKWGGREGNSLLAEWKKLNHK